MTQEEKYGVRDGAYSAWHRRQSISRFVPMKVAEYLSMIDVDAMLCLEMQRGTNEPALLIEAAVDVGQRSKISAALQKLAMRTNPIVPAFTVLYRLSNTMNPADQNWQDIDMFRVRRLWPGPEKNFRVVTPMQWADGLVKLREWSLNGLLGDMPLFYKNGPQK